MQVSAEALQQAGGAVRSTGTYIGCMFVDYLSLQREAYGLSSTGAVSPKSALLRVGLIKAVGVVWT